MNRIQEAQLIAASEGILVPKTNAETVASSDQKTTEKVSTMYARIKKIEVIALKYCPKDSTDWDELLALTSHLEPAAASEASKKNA